MELIYREFALFLFVLVGVIVFVVKFIVSDLPDDFLSVFRRRLDQQREALRGRLRDNG